MTVRGPVAASALGSWTPTITCSCARPAHARRRVRRPRAVDRRGAEGRASGHRHDRRHDADRARPAARRSCARWRMRPGCTSSPRPAITATRTTPTATGSTTRRSTARGPDPARPRGRHAPGRLGRSRRRPRPGASRRDQGRRLVPPCQRRRAAAARGVRDRQRPRWRAGPGPHRDRHRSATRSSTCSPESAWRRTGSSSPTSTATRTPELHAEIAARGVYLEYDTMGRTKYRPDSELLDLIERVVAGRAPRSAPARPGHRTPLDAPRLRRRPGHALPDGDASCRALRRPHRRRGDRRDPGRQPGACLQRRGRRTA